jgi:hypothetical protein
MGVSFVGTEMDQDYLKEAVARTRLALERPLPATGELF